MPVKLKANYDALVVVIEESKEGTDFLEKELKRTFEKQKMIYYKNSSMGGTDIFFDIYKRIENGEIFFPVSERILILNCVDLEDVNEAWLDAYMTRMEELKRQAGAISGTQHYYITCFRYRTIKPLDGQLEEKIEVLNRMGDVANGMSMSHVEFLLYAGGFSKLDNQEKGLVRLLRVLSVSDWTAVYDVANYRNALHVLGYEEYYESRAVICQNKMAEIDAWLKDKKDPDLNNFFIDIQNFVQQKIKVYEDELRYFKKWTGLYPVSVREYSSTGIGPFKKYIKNSHKNSELEKEELDWKAKFFEDLKQDSEKEVLLEKLTAGLNYMDCRSLQELKKEGFLNSRIHSIISKCTEQIKGLKESERDQFVSVFETWIDPYVDELTCNLEEERQKKEDEYTRYENEQNIASKYDDLRTCFAQIRNTLTYQVPKSIQAGILDEIVLVSDVISDKWVSEGYDIEGIADNNVFVCGDIYPAEIQYLKIAKYISLNASETINQFKMVIH